MRRLTGILIGLVALALPIPAFAGHSNLTVPPSDTFLLGGDQKAAMVVSGKNVGTTEVAIRARTGTTDTEIARVAPGATFEHSFAAGEVALIGNLSAKTAARLSVDFTGSPDSLSMRYALPQQ